MDIPEGICSLLNFRDPDGIQDVLAITPDAVKHVTLQTRPDLNLFESVTTDANGLQIFTI